MNANNEEPRLMAQWIVSLAVSVVCCAVLFVVFAGYIVDLHDALTLTTVRLEVAQEKLSSVTNEVETLRRAVMPQSMQKAEPQKTDAPLAPQAAVPEAPSSQPVAPTQDAKPVEGVVSPAASGAPVVPPSTKP